MWSLFNPDNKFAQFVIKFVDTIIVSFLWIFLCFTVIGIGPATMALYHTCVKVIRRDRGTLLKEFFGSIREGWKTAIPAGIIAIILVVSGVLVDIPNFLILFIQESSGQLIYGIISAVKLFIALGILCYLFPIISRFRVGIVKAVILSVVFSFRHFLTTIGLVLGTALAIFALANTPVLLFVLPALYMLGVSCLMERILKKHMTKEDRELDQSKDQWYLEV